MPKTYSQTWEGSSWVHIQYMWIGCILHDRWVWISIEAGPGRPWSGLQKGPVYLWVQFKCEFWPEPVNRHSPDPRHKPTVAHIWTRSRSVSFTAPAPENDKSLQLESWVLGGKLPSSEPVGVNTSQGSYHIVHSTPHPFTGSHTMALINEKQSTNGGGGFLIHLPVLHS